MPMAVSNLCASIGGVFVQSRINSYGTTVVAGYTAANKLDQLAISGMNSLSNAMSTYAGQNIGAGRPDRVREGIRAGWIVGLAIALAFGLILFGCGSTLVRMFVSGEEKEAIAVASGFFRTVSPFYMIGCCMYIYLGAMRGMGEITIPMAGSFTELAGKLLAVLFLSRISYHAMWAAWPVGWAVAFALLWIYYRFFLWKKHQGKPKEAAS
jgi:Na+-driven multidrug efflux pump